RTRSLCTPFLPSMRPPCRCRRIWRWACRGRRNGSMICRWRPMWSLSPATAPNITAVRRFMAPRPTTRPGLINSAVESVDGDLTKKDAMRAAMRKANYASVRGPYRYGNNHFPIENFYLQETIKRPDGSYGLRTAATILKDSQDSFHDKCPMKW